MSVQSKIASPALDDLPGHPDDHRRWPPSFHGLSGHYVSQDIGPAGPLGYNHSDTYTDRNVPHTSTGPSGFNRSDAHPDRNVSRTSTGPPGFNRSDARPDRNVPRTSTGPSGFNHSDARPDFNVPRTSTGPSGFNHSDARPDFNVPHTYNSPVDHTAIQAELISLQNLTQTLQTEKAQMNAKLEAAKCFFFFKHCVRHLQQSLVTLIIGFLIHWATKSTKPSPTSRNYNKRY